MKYIIILLYEYSNHDISVYINEFPWIGETLINELKIQSYVIIDLIKEKGHVSLYL